MNILFVNYRDFTSQSAIHLFYLANHLMELGVDCAVCVPDNPQSVRFIGTPRFQTLTYEAALSQMWKFRDGKGPSIIHAWTPREIVREQTEKLIQRFSCPYMVHLEDNEEHIAGQKLGISIQQMKHLSPILLDEMIGVHLSHPIRYRQFLQRSAGITVLIDSLMRFVPSGVRSRTIWPGYDRNLFFKDPPVKTLRASLGLREDDFVVVYPGNVHAANRKEVLSLYLAVGLLNRQGERCRLIRSGKDGCALLDRHLQELNQFVIEVGYVPYAEIPQYLALANALVQPGGPDEFNDFRFPSKLTEFLGMGKPVILPKTNLGRFLRDGEECLLMERGDAIEIADKLKKLKNDEALFRYLGDNGHAFAQKNFNWSEKAAEYYDFYQEIA